MGKTNPILKMKVDYSEHLESRSSISNRNLGQKSIKNLVHSMI